jgi:hypothetical protein
MSYKPPNPPSRRPAKPRRFRWTFWAGLAVLAAWLYLLWWLLK